MGQHTWFLKNKTDFFREKQISDLLEKHEVQEIHVDNYLELDSEFWNLHDSNKTEYHDIFRTNKRNTDNSYIEVELFSYDETVKWIEENEETIYHSFDSKELIALLKNSRASSLANAIATPSSTILFSTISSHLSP